MNKENEEYSRDLFKSLEKYDSEFTEIIYNFSQVEVEKVCKLSDKDNFLCILSVLIGCQSLSMFANVLDVALKKNVDVIAIKEMLYQATAYLGIGRTYDYLIKANEIMSKNDIALPLGSQATTNETNRFSRLSISDNGLSNIPIYRTAKSPARKQPEPTAGPPNGFSPNERWQHRPLPAT